MHAYALEVLQDKLKPGAKALDIGSGTGYLTACFAHMVKKKLQIFISKFKISNRFKNKSSDFDTTKRSAKLAKLLG